MSNLFLGVAEKLLREMKDQGQEEESGAGRKALGNRALRAAVPH
jgi:hypothetical protein